MGRYLGQRLAVLISRAEIEELTLGRAGSQEPACSRGGTSELPGLITLLLLRTSAKKWSQAPSPKGPQAPSLQFWPPCTPVSTNIACKAPCKLSKWSYFYACNGVATVGENCYIAPRLQLLYSSTPKVPYVYVYSKGRDPVSGKYGIAGAHTAVRNRACDRTMATP